jgi:hypothetical protein
MVSLYTARVPMECSRLQHDTAFYVTTQLLEILSPLVRDDERRDVWNALYPVVLAGIESYQIQKSRIEQRLRPGTN